MGRCGRAAREWGQAARRLNRISAVGSAEKFVSRLLPERDATIKGERESYEIKESGSMCSSTFWTGEVKGFKVISGGWVLPFRPQPQGIHAWKHVSSHTPLHEWTYRSREKKRICYLGIIYV